MQSENHNLQPAKYTLKTIICNLQKVICKIKFVNVICNVSSVKCKSLSNFRYYSKFFLQLRYDWFKNIKKNLFSGLCIIPTLWRTGLLYACTLYIYDIRVPIQRYITVKKWRCSICMLNVYTGGKVRQYLFSFITKLLPCIHF